MKNILKMTAILIVALILTSCRGEEKPSNFNSTGTAAATLAEETSSQEAPSHTASQGARSEKPQESSQRPQESSQRPQESSQRPQEQPKEEVKREETSSAAASSDIYERLKVGEREHKEMEAEVIRLMNEHRAEAGLAPLRTCDIYYNCVERRAEECTMVWSHTRPNGKSYFDVYTEYPIIAGFKAVGENLGKTFVSAEQIVKALMDSEPHRRNILYPEYTDVCVAIVMMDQSEQIYSMPVYAMAQHFYKREEL
ncbi:MAG: hypothetical protein IIX89_03620 [Oscillospiraceae bacterium]|nr:hypothetical protein [Oscillospiraceae bacterium]